jgi:leucyl-tRNA synthetase
MFMGPLEEMKPWSTRGVEGVFRFLNRLWRLCLDDAGNPDPRLSVDAPTPELERVYHTTVKKVGEDIEGLRFNTAIAQLMIFINEVMKTELRPRAIIEPFILLVAPFAPHIAEELWEKLGHSTSLSHEPWPVFDAAKIRSNTIEIVLQVNGKLRGKMEVPVDTTQEDLKRRAAADEGVAKYTAGKAVVNMIVVKNRLVNIVVR